mgnify:CR=1 FL=1
MQYDLHKIHDMIYGRRSVRRYADTVDMDELRETVDTGLTGASSLPGQEKPTVQVLDGVAAISAFTGIVGHYGKVEAPAYLLFSARPRGAYLTQAGYVGEQLVLWLASRGYGTCWIGIPINTRRLLAYNPLPAGETYIILMAVGKPAAGMPLLRDENGYKRRALEDMVTGEMRDEWQPVLEAGRIAPSASNGQPWHFACTAEGIELYCTLGRGLIKKKYYHHLNRIDGGIALAHLWLAARAAGFDVNLEKINGPAARMGNDIKDVKLLPIMGMRLEKKP